MDELDVFFVEEMDAFFVDELGVLVEEVELLFVEVG
jgi:hypothetical protein